MRKATCFILSLLIFTTPLFAIKEAIYNAQGVKVGYIEKVNGQTIYYDEWGNRTDRIDMKELIMKELEWRKTVDEAFPKSVDPALDAFNEAYERGLRQKRLKNSSSSSTSSSSSSSSSSSTSLSNSYSIIAKVCPMSYCKHNNSTSAKFCSQCAYSLADVPNTTESVSKLSMMGWISGIAFIVIIVALLPWGT